MPGGVDRRATRLSGRGYTMRILRYAVLTAALLGTAAACSDPLEVENSNNPDRDRVLANPADVENLAGSLYQQINSATLGNIARVQTGLMTAAFENSSGLANNGLGPRSNIPRGQIDNGRGNPYASENFNDFSIHSAVAKTAAEILARSSEEGFTLGSDGANTRLRAWTWFMYGTALGNLALVYDSAGVPRPSDGPLDIPALEEYPAVMAEALEALDSAVVFASTPGMSNIPNTWLKGSAYTPVEFTRVVRSYAARFRAGVARTPEERAAVDWGLVIADATNGIESDLAIEMLPTAGWDRAWLSSTLHFRDANWHQMTLYIIGMADTSGAYEGWLQTPRDNRDGNEVLIRTPDLRFPSGETREAQNDVGQGAPEAGRYFRNRDDGLDQAGTGWRNSQYDHYRWRAYASANRIGFFPVMTRAEIDLLAAEGYIRTGNFPLAAALIDRTRTAAGLPSVAGITDLTTPVPGGNACVPQIPVGPSYTATACGNILEAMKWEKRMETAYTGYGVWFFDSRGWGDLVEGTALHWPVPFQEMDARLKPVYNLGGLGGGAAAGVSTYGFGTAN
jgi:hypothetical protein